MIVKNITFVVSKTREKDFIDIIFKATDLIHQSVEEIKVFKLLEQVEPDSFNYALQLSFQNAEHLEDFNQERLVEMIEHIQNQSREPVLYFESHLEKVF